MKRTIILLSIIGFVILAWTGVWFFIENKVVTSVDHLKTRLAEKGQRFDCIDQATGGYPFRITFKCAQIGYLNERTRVAFDSGELRTAAQAYQPGKVIAELESPANLGLANGLNLATNWSSMRASLNANLQGLDNFSMLGKSITAIPDGRQNDAFDIKELQIHGRHSEGETIQFALSSSGVKDVQNRWPVFDAGTTIAIHNAYSQLAKKPDLLSLARREGLKGDIESLNYKPESGGELDLSGPFTVTPNGIVSGTFTIKASDISSLLGALSKGMPGYANELQQLGSAVQLLGGKSSERSFDLTLKAKEGVLYFGFIKVADIPPIY